MSSSYRLERRKEQGVWNFGPWEDHYIASWGNCHPGDIAVPIGRDDGIKVCLKNRPPPQDPYFNALKSGEKVNGLYKSYNIYEPSAEFQNRPYNPWPEGGLDRDNAILKDYIKVPIRYNGSGLENMKQISGQEAAYAFQLVDRPPEIPVQELPWSIPSESDPGWKANYDLTRLHSSPARGDLRNDLYNKYKHPFKTDFYHTHHVQGNYPNNRTQYRFLSGSKTSNV